MTCRCLDKTKATATKPCPLAGSLVLEPRTSLEEHICSSRIVATSRSWQHATPARLAEKPHWWNSNPKRSLRESSRPLLLCKGMVLLRPLPSGWPALRPRLLPPSCQEAGRTSAGRSAWWSTDAKPQFSPLIATSTQRCRTSSLERENERGAGCGNKTRTWPWPRPTYCEIPSLALPFHRQRRLKLEDYRIIKGLESSPFPLQSYFAVAFEGFALESCSAWAQEMPRTAPALTHGLARTLKSTPKISLQSADLWRLAQAQGKLVHRHLILLYSSYLKQKLDNKRE